MRHLHLAGPHAHLTDIPPRCPGKSFPVPAFGPGLAL